MTRKFFASTFFTILSLHLCFLLRKMYNNHHSVFHWVEATAAAMIVVLIMADSTVEAVAMIAAVENVGTAAANMAAAMVAAAKTTATTMSTSKTA